VADRAATGECDLQCACGRKARGCPPVSASPGGCGFGFVAFWSQSPSNDPKVRDLGFENDCFQISRLRVRFLPGVLQNPAGKAGVPPLSRAGGGPNPQPTCGMLASTGTDSDQLDMLASAMLHEAKLARSECDLLAALIGQPLHRVTTDRWAVQLGVGASMLLIVPEEVTTPDAEHPYGDVDRPRVGVGRPTDAAGDIVVAERLGIVHEANVISTLVTFSPVEDCTGEEIMPGVVMPKSTEYDYVYHHPDRRADAERDVGAGALVDLDIGVELITDKCASLVVYARAHWVMVSVDGLPLDEEWVAEGACERRSVSDHAR
jgi:hypothetical protein